MLLQCLVSLVGVVTNGASLLRLESLYEYGVILSQFLHHLFCLLVGMLVQVFLVSELHVLGNIEEQLSYEHVIHKVK